MSSNITQSAREGSTSLLLSFPTQPTSQGASVSSAHEQKENLPPPEFPVAPSPTSGEEPFPATKKIFQISYQSLPFLFLKTVKWIAAGVAIMVTGIVLVRFLLLPRIYDCPIEASCFIHLDLNGDVLRYLQLGMGYWLQLGSIIAGVGLLKLASYHSWFDMQDKGRKIGVLQCNIEALDSSLTSALKLFFVKRCNRTLAMIAISQMALTAVIPLVVTYSISKTAGTEPVLVDFGYAGEVTLMEKDHNGTYYFPNLSGPHGTSRFGYEAIRPETFRGTLIVPDNRTTLAIHARPSGSRIIANVSCGGEGFSFTVESNSEPFPIGKRTNVTILDHEQGVNKSMQLDPSRPLQVQYTRNSTSGTSENGDVVMKSQLIWIASSDHSKAIPNSSLHGNLYIAICNHTISMVNIEPPGFVGQNVSVRWQDIEPSDVMSGLLELPPDSVWESDSTRKHWQDQLVLMAVDRFIYNHWWYEWPSPDPPDKWGRVMSDK